MPLMLDYADAFAMPPHAFSSMLLLITLRRCSFRYDIATLFFFHYAFSAAAFFAASAALRCFFSPCQRRFIIAIFHACLMTTLISPYAVAHAATLDD